MFQYLISDKANAVFMILSINCIFVPLFRGLVMDACAKGNLLNRFRSLSVQSTAHSMMT